MSFVICIISYINSFVNTFFKKRKNGSSRRRPLPVCAKFNLLVVGRGLAPAVCVLWSLDSRGRLSLQPKYWIAHQIGRGGLAPTAFYGSPRTSTPTGLIVFLNLMPVGEGSPLPPNWYEINGRPKRLPYGRNIRFRTNFVGDDILGVP